MNSENARPTFGASAAVGFGAAMKKLINVDRPMSGRYTPSDSTRHGAEDNGYSKGRIKLSLKRPK